MITFWIVVAIMTIAALLFVVPPLLGRGAVSAVQRRELNIAIYRERLAELEGALTAGDLDRAAFDSSKVELEQELLYGVDDSEPARTGHSEHARVAPIAVLLLLPLLALALYLQLGAHRIIPFIDDPESQQQVDTQHDSNVSVAAMVERLEQRMEATPEDLRGWVMLARSYMELERYSDAVGAYARAVELDDEIAPLLIDYAEALGVANGGDLQGQPTTLLERAVVLEPEQAKGRWLAGVAGFQRGDFEGAASHWRHLLASAELDAEMSALVRDYLARAEAELTPEQRSRLDAATPAVAAAEPSIGAAIEVSVALDPALSAQVEPNDTLFIFARAASGPRMPLATVRKQASDLPLTVTLSDAQAMVANMRLSSFEQVVIGARISKSGNAIPQSGDLEGLSAPLAPTTTDAIAVTIDRVHP